MSNNFEELNKKTDERLALFRQRIADSKKEQEEILTKQKEESRQYVVIDMSDVPEAKELYYDDRVHKIITKAEQAYQNVLFAQDTERDNEIIIKHIKELCSVMDLLMTEQCKTRF